MASFFPSLSVVRGTRQQGGFESLFFCNCPGCGFARTQIANSTYTKKEFNPMDFVHGRGNGKNRHGLTPASLA